MKKRTRISKGELVRDAKPIPLIDSKISNDMATHHKLIIGNCMSMIEIPDETVHLMVTSPPYFNAPFDYKHLFKNYDQYLGVLNRVAKELFRVLQNGRIAVLNIDDMLVNGEKFPIVADATKIFQSAGFRYRDRIIWKKPDGYLRISRRSGVLLQNPYPMYFYPDNLLESIIIFQKGRFDYRSISKDIRERSKIDVKEFSSNKWYMTLWEMTNVLPGASLEKDIAAFPDELVYRIIKLFSYEGETVIDPFAGSGTTMKVARKLRRNSIGIEIKKSLIPIVKKKTGFDGQLAIENQHDTLDIIIRTGVKDGCVS
jgi:site-specific DNA-methyltransferase (adenine-specific)